MRRRGLGQRLGVGRLRARQQAAQRRRRVAPRAPRRAVRRPAPRAARRNFSVSLRANHSREPTHGSARCRRAGWRVPIGLSTRAVAPDRRGQHAGALVPRRGRGRPRRCGGARAGIRGGGRPGQSKSARSISGGAARRSRPCRRRSSGARQQEGDEARHRVARQAEEPGAAAIHRGRTRPKASLARLHRRSATRSRACSAAHGGAQVVFLAHRTRRRWSTIRSCPRRRGAARPGGVEPVGHDAEVGALAPRPPRSARAA